MWVSWFSIARFGIIVCLVSCFLFSRAQTFSKLYPDPLRGGGYVAWADYDQDGDPDVITSGVFKNGVAATVLYRNDQGQFVDTEEDFEGFTGKIQWIDWENDGDLDLFLCDPEIKIFRNDNGVFTNHPTAGYYQSTMWKDYDGDHDLDLLGLRENGIFLMENQEGIFQFRYLIPTIPDVMEFDVGDFNSDGHTDLLIKRGPYHDVTIKLYLNEDEYFSADNSNSFVSLSNGAVQSFDYDEDGDTDILLKGTIADGDARSGYLYKNDAGVFTLTSHAFFDTGYPILFNLDTDESLEVMKGNVTGDSLIFFDNSGNGQFTRITNSVLYEYNNIISVSYGSVTGEQPNSYLCVSGNLYNGNFAMRVYNKNAAVFENIYHSPFDQLKASEALSWIDFNNDGLQDIYLDGASLPGYSFSKLYQNTGTGFTKVYEFEDDDVGKGEWIDFNKDGKMDFLTMADTDILLHEGFTEAQVTRTKVATIRDPDAFPRAVDFDNDTDYDLAINGYMEGLYTNNSGVFAQSFQFIDGYRYLGLSAWADYDLDGDQDFAMHLDGGSIGGIAAHLYKNTNGTFKKDPAIVFPPLDYAEFFWFDYNLDEYPDLFLYGNYGGVNVFKLYKNVEGEFSLLDAPVFSNSLDLEWPVRIQLVDFNIDGHPDIVIGGDTHAVSASKLSFYENKNGTFEIYSGHSIPTMQEQNFRWTDYDNDGDPDMLHTGIHDHPETQIYENNIIDDKGPVIHSLSPRNKEVLSLENGFALKIKFHEPLSKGNGMLRIYRKNGDQLLYQVNVSESSITINENIVDVNIQGISFNANDEIYILIDNGTFKDLRNNPGIGISDKSIWTLTINGEAKISQSILFSSLPAVQVTDQSFVLTAVASSNLPVSYISSNPSVASISGNIVDIHGAGTTLIRATQAGNDIYSEAPSVEQLLAVSKLTQDINFEPLAIGFIGDDPSELVASATSGLVVNYASSNTLVASVSGSTIIIHGAGSTVITATQPGNDFYNAATPVQQALTIKKIAQQLTFPPLPGKFVGDEPFEIQVQASSELPVVLSLSNSEVATLAGNILTIIGVGEVEITATQEGNERFETAIPISQLFVVSMVTDIEERYKDKAISVFPNPMADELAIVLNDANPESLVLIHFFDTYGRLKKEVVSKDKDHLILSVDDLNAGVFILKILYHDAIFWRRVIKK